MATSIDRLHPTTTATTQGGAELGRQVMSLRYDLVSETLQGMLREVARQADAEAACDRATLAGQLDNLRLCLATAVGAAKGLAAFCKPWIDEERAAPAPMPALHKGWRYECFINYEWREVYEVFPPHAARLYKGGKPDLWQCRNIEPVFTSAEALAPGNLAFTEDMYRSFSETAMPGAWDTIPEEQREQARHELGRAIRSFLAPARVQPAPTTSTAE